jgi:alanine racemase
MENEFQNDSYIEINLANIEHNYSNVLKNKINKDTKVIAVIKSNAYGHGLIPVAKTLEKLNVDYLGVFNIKEGLRLRASGIKSKILIFGNVKDYEFDKLVKYDLTPIISTYEELRILDNLPFQDNLKIHIKVDTGMGRLGFLPEEAEEITKKLYFHNKKIYIEGICTHFSNASSLDKSYTINQVQTFMAFLDNLSKDGIKIPIIHASNSAAILNYPEYQFNCVRPGLLLYGVSPFTEDYGLKEALSLHSTISTIRNIGKNSFISYNCTFSTKRESKIAVIPLGYADGIMYSLSNKGSILINGNRFPIIGSVCMNQFLVDITDGNNISSYDKITIIGKSGNEKISVKEVAKNANTIPYEILCRLSGSIKRVYIY